MSRSVRPFRVLSEYDFPSPLRPDPDYTKLSSSSSDNNVSRGSMEEVALLPYDGTLPYESIPIVAGPTASHAAWPPIVMRIEKLGYIVDSE